MKGNLEIKIDPRITEQDFMEYCLNLKASGYDPQIILAFYSLGKSWNIEKLLFMMEELRK